MNLNVEWKLFGGLGLVMILSCQESVKSLEEGLDHSVSITDDYARAKASQIRQEVSAEVDPRLELKLWASDTLLADPVALDMDDNGRAFVTRTNRRRSSEFDIRRYPEWEVASQSFKTVEDRRQFIRETHTPENSGTYGQPLDLNGDGLQTWEDLTIESEEVYRIEDKSGDGLADHAFLVATGFNTEVTDIAGGVLSHEGDVYLAVAPDLWRLQDLDGDGYMEAKESLMSGFQVHIGFGGHNMSGLKVGPDGKIYWGIGDIGFNGTDRNGKKWYYPNEGVIVRCNPDGSDFEVFASGLRNTHEFTFDEYGNLITVDNDGDHPGESERLTYIVDGSDSGWRINWQFGKYRDPDNNTYKVWMDEELYKPRFDGQAAFITPCIRNYINGPTGMIYNPGTGLGKEWKDHFFVVEFNGNPARSGIHSFTLETRGASFDFVDSKKILGGVLATGMDFGVDGALYFTDWIDGWAKKGYGRIWKLDVKNEDLVQEREHTALVLKSDFSSRSEADLSDLLADEDMRVRLKAQFELVKRGASGAVVLAGAIQQTDQQIARIHGIWGTGQLIAQDVQFAPPLLSLLDDPDAEVRAQAAKALGAVRYGDAGDALIALLSDENDRVKFFAAEALGRIANHDAVEPLIQMLKQNNDRDAHLRHAGSLALARIGDTQAIAALANSESRALRVAAVVALRRLRAPEIVAFLSDSDEYIVTETARAINDDLSIGAALPELGNILSREFTAEPLIRRSINANGRVGTDDAIANLVDFAGDNDRDPVLRAEAIATLGVWQKPSVFDRVDGRYRGVFTREAGPVYRIAGPVLLELLKDPVLVVREAAVVAIGKLGYTQGVFSLETVQKEDKEPSMRALALTTLAKLEADDMPLLLEAGLNDPQQEVRIAAIALINKVDGNPDLLAEMLAGTLEDGSAAEQQAAMQALAELPRSSTESMVEDLLKRLARGDIDPVIHLDLIEVAEEMQSPKLNALISSYRGSLDVEGELAKYIECVEGGDPGKGRNTLVNNSNAQCLKCHNISGYGGVAGPALDDVGLRLTGRELVESLVDPSVDIAPGFGVVTLILNDDSTVSGILESESSSRLVVRNSDEENIAVDKANIKERINAMSSMPPMGSVLSKQEIRDLVAFLKDLRTVPEPEEGEGAGAF